MKKKAVVLLSGGIDSATTLYIARSRGYSCVCLIFDYGQKNRKEIRAAKSIARHAGCVSHLIKIRLPWGGSSLLEKRLRIPKHRKLSYKGVPTTYVPARNTIFLSFALSFAEAEGAEAIFIGAHTQDYSGYPDCRPVYFRAFSRMGRLGTKRGAKGRGIKIIAPLLQKDKGEIIKIGTRLETPYALTRSCYMNAKRPCGKCDSCLYRAKGFAAAGIEDPIYGKG